MVGNAGVLVEVVAEEDVVARTWPQEVLPDLRRIGGRIAGGADAGGAVDAGGGVPAWLSAKEELAEVVFRPAAAGIEQRSKISSAANGLGAKSYTTKRLRMRKPKPKRNKLHFLIELPAGEGCGNWLLWPDVLATVPFASLLLLSIVARSHVHRRLTTR